VRAHHLAVVVADLGRSERFYCGLLGLPVERRHVDDRGQPRSLWVGLEDGLFLAIEKGDGAAPTRADSAPGWHCVALKIEPEQRAAWRTKLEAAGYPIVRETTFTIYVRDPDGQLVGLSHYPAPAA
jgi:glyoxylase I family protein